MTPVRVVTIAESELAALLRAAVAEALAEFQTDDLGWVKLRATGLPVKTLAAAIRSGALPARQVGRERWAKREDLERWLESLPRVELAQPETEEGDELERAIRSGQLRSVGGGR